MEEQRDKEKDRKSLLITGGVQVILLLVLYLLVAWREPNPPIPEYGVELSFGVATGGSPARSQQRPTTAPTLVEQEAPIPEPQPANAEEASASDGQEAIEDPVPGDLPIEESGEPEQSETTEEVTASENTTTDEQEAQESQEVAAPAVRQPAPDVSEESTPSSEESDTNTSGVGSDTGDEVQGEPEAEIDERALYGSVTGQDGASLQMSGWIWDFEPTPQDNSQESGKIVYKVTIDDEGYIIKIVPQTSTVSPSVEKYYRQAVERLTFSKTSSYKPAPTSNGTITFIIKTK